MLEIDPDNAKALLRAGRVSLSLDDFESAEACLQRVCFSVANDIRDFSILLFTIFKTYYCLAACRVCFLAEFYSVSC